MAENEDFSEHDYGHPVEEKLWKATRSLPGLLGLMATSFSSRAPDPTQSSSAVRGSPVQGTGPPVEFTPTSQSSLCSEPSLVTKPSLPSGSSFLPDTSTTGPMTKPRPSPPVRNADFAQCMQLVKKPDHKTGRPIESFVNSCSALFGSVLLKEFANLGTEVRREALEYCHAGVSIDMVEYMSAREALRAVALRQWFREIWVTEMQAQDVLLLRHLKFLHDCAPEPMGRHILGTEPDITAHAGGLGEVPMDHRQLYGPYYTSMIAFTGRVRLVLSRVIKLNEEISYLDLLAQLQVISEAQIGHASALRTLRGDKLSSIGWQDLEYESELFRLVKEMSIIWTDIDGTYNIPDLRIMEQSEGTLWSTYLAIGVDLSVFPSRVTVSSQPRRGEGPMTDRPPTPSRVGEDKGQMTGQPPTLSQLEQHRGTRTSQPVTPSRPGHDRGPMTGSFVHPESRVGAPKRMPSKNVPLKQPLVGDEQVIRNLFGKRSAVDMDHGTIQASTPEPKSRRPAAPIDVRESSGVASVEAHRLAADSRSTGLMAELKFRQSLINLSETVAPDSPIPHDVIEHFIWHPPSSMKDLLYNARSLGFANQCARRNVDLLEFILDHKPM